MVGSLSPGIYDGKPYGGFYSQEEVRDLVQYAAERYVTIIPEIEIPGHSLAAISCYPELSCGLEDHYETATRWGIFRQVYCPKEETFKFLEDVFDEVIELANDCIYGLTSSIYTTDYDTVMRAMNEIKFGETYVNREHFEAFQGFHQGVRQSGIGGEDGERGLEEYLETHICYIDYDLMRNKA